MKKEYILRIGLAFVLIYASISQLLYPQDWIGYVPTWVTMFHTTREMTLQSHIIADFVLGILILLPWQKRWVAAIIALDILSIVVLNGFSNAVFETTFRDIGLIAMAVYLVIS